MRVGLAGATFEQKRALVELLVDRVIVTDEDVEIRYASFPPRRKDHTTLFVICVKTI